MAKHNRKVLKALKARQDATSPKPGWHMPGSMNSHKTGLKGNGPGR